MIYTSIFGGYDARRDDVRVFDQPSGRLGSPRMEAKRYKVLNHLTPEIWREHHRSVWIDGNVCVNAPEDELFSSLTDGVELAIFSHHCRSTIRQEVEAVVNFGYESASQAERVLSDYPREADALPLLEATVLFRRHTGAVAMFNSIWWSLICSYSHRDQLTLPIAVAMAEKYCGLRFKAVSGNLRNHPMFTCVTHGEALHK